MTKTKSSKGRPKGYSPYVEISYEELGDWVGRKALVKVSKAWLEGMGAYRECADTCDKPLTSQEPKIEFNLTDLNDE